MAEYQLTDPYPYPHTCGACGRVYNTDDDGTHCYHSRLHAYVCAGDCMRNLHGEDVTLHTMSWFWKVI